MEKSPQNNIRYDASVGGERKKSMFLAMLQCKCPICTEGDMFKTSATNLKKFNELKEQCPVCDFRFMPEPGFYQISTYFTYAINVTIFVIFGFATYYLFGDPPLWAYYTTIFTPAIIAVPWNLRYSKVVMLYIFGDVWPSKR